MPARKLSSPRHFRYVLWLAPSGAARTRLRRLIWQLAARHGGEPFLPHVTLLGQLAGVRRNILARSRSLARDIAPFTIQLARAGMHDCFFEALFIHARRSPPLMRANRLARSVFGKSGKGSFMPHLSLLYGDLPAETKEAILDRIGRRFDLVFDARCLELWEIRGGPGQWRRVARIPLRGAKP